MLFFVGISQLELAGYLAAAPALASHLLHLPTTAESPTTYRPLFNTAKAKVKKKMYPSRLHPLPITHERNTRKKKLKIKQHSRGHVYMFMYKYDRAFGIHIFRVEIRRFSVHLCAQRGIWALLQGASKYNLNI